jgi:uncharacterized protein
MRIGILSDSHGHDAIVAEALRLFDALGVELVVHCGDVGGMGVLDQLAGRRCGLVWGNMDTPDSGVRRYLESVGLSVPATPPLRLALDGKVALVFHGHERGFAAAVRAPDVDYILHGHTHRARDERIGRVRVINPGALQRANPRTVATLDTATDAVQFYAYDAKRAAFDPWAGPG